MPAGSLFVLVLRQREKLPGGAFREKLLSTDRVGRHVTVLIQSKADLTAPAGLDRFTVKATNRLSSGQSN